MIKRLNDNTLIELTKSSSKSKKKVSWKIILTDKAKRQISLNFIDLKKIAEWEQELLNSN